MDLLDSAQRTIDAGVPWVSAYGLWVVALTGLGQGLPGVMFIVPGLAINMAAGYFAAEGAFSFGQALGAAWIGSYAGLMLSYTGGWRIGAFKRRSRLQVRRRVAAALQREPFILPLYYVYCTPVRSVLPYLAGVQRYPPLRWALLNAIAVVPWLALQLAYGIFARQALEGGNAVGYGFLLALMLTLSIGATLLMLRHLGLRPELLKEDVADQLVA